ncbi:unnamed protein product [Leptidea sinapis]|uniref:Uncharacterized protein n=1 Tax=Leptidea sinapis TaxID=189913 RepID=A0A5E4QZZ5_9NEOP|nr:unnamed protein product [Leptidea sinapis]
MLISTSAVGLVGDENLDVRGYLETWWRDLFSLTKLVALSYRLLSLIAHEWIRAPYYYSDDRRFESRQLNVRRRKLRVLRLENGSRSPGNNLNRHSWTRTSLRRTPPSQLYRSSSFNSSGCGSGGEPADDMYSDVSLEEDVQGLNYKVSGHS